MTSSVVRKEVRGGIGLVKLERVQVICPACGQEVEAVATDSRVKGYCAVTKQYVDFVIETQLEGKKWWQSPEYRAKLSAAIKKKWQNPEYRAKQIGTHTGKHPTAETRAKLSAALTRRQNKKRGIRVNKDVKNSKVGRLDMPASPVGILPAPVVKI